MPDDLYHIILDEFHHLRRVGQLDRPSLRIDAKNASCGDSAEIDIQLDDSAQPATSRITDIKWHGDGCALSQVALSVLTDHIAEHQLSLTEIAKLTEQDLLDWLGLTEINPSRLNCLLFGLRAFQKKVIELETVNQR
jgi:nitrogen fixation protein NifU and related proteins